MALFGLGYLVYNLRYPFGTLADPGPGVFPLVVGLGMTSLAFGHLLRSWPSLKPEGQKEDRAARLRGSAPQAAREKPVILMILFFMAYLLALEWIGFLVSTFFLVVITCKLMGARGWFRPAGLALGILLFCYFLFDVWLKIFLPRGFFI